MTEPTPFGENRLADGRVSEDSVLSPQNHRIKRLRRLLSQRKARSTERAFVAEGPVLVTEVLGSDATVQDVFVDAELADSVDEISELAAHCGVDVHVVSSGVLASLLDTMSPQPVVAVVDDPEVSLADFALDSPVLVLHELRDPGNVGTLLRTAEAAGFAGVVLTGESVDSSNPKVVRAAAGARFRVPVVSGLSLDDASTQLREQGRSIAATVVSDGGSDRTTVADYLTVDLTTAAIVLGNEAHGLSSTDVALADSAVTIPLAGPTESLNVAAAGAVMCFASWNQRRSVPS